MNLNELKTKAQSILATATTENRSLSAIEKENLDTLKTQIAAAEKEVVEGVESQKRSAAAAVATMSPDNLPSSDYLRSLAKGNADVGNKEVINDVVRVYESQSPIFSAHKNVQKRNNGMAFSFTKVAPGGAGYGKTEGDAGTTDTASTLEMAVVSFTTYSGQVVPVSQELLDDAAADVSQEVTALGMYKSTHAWEADAVTQITSPFKSSGTITSGYYTSSSGTLLMQDLVDLYYSVPVRNRTQNLTYTCNSTMAKKIVGLLTNTNAPQAAAIHLTPDNITECSSMPNGVVVAGDLTLALAIGMKVPVRTLVIPTSAGANFEVQPRLAVALRDSSALGLRYTQ